MDQERRRQLEERRRAAAARRGQVAFAAGLERGLESRLELLWALEMAGVPWVCAFASPERDPDVAWLESRFRFVSSSIDWSQAHDVEAAEQVEADGLGAWLRRLVDARELGDPTATVLWDERGSPVLRLPLQAFVAHARAFVERSPHVMNFFVFDPEGDWCIAYREFDDQVTFGRSRGT